MQTIISDKCVWGLVLAVCCSPDAQAGVDKPLLAHWTFDEDGNSAEIVNAAGDAALDVRADAALPRVRGVHGRALHLTGPHQMPVAIGPHLDRIKSISFSAWTKPRDLSGYREIFRQECPERLLFSYQANGSILSLGLNIGGYVECDAAIKPEAVMDGVWHHCAATFDGQWMRVYLDGREVSSLKRPGRLTLNSTAAGFIGSSSGRGEHFQGTLDDLRIYTDALTADEVQALYRAGLAEIVERSTELATDARDLIAPGKTFAQVLAGTHRLVAKANTELDPDLADAILAKLKLQFPDQYTEFLQWSAAGPIGYLTAKDDQFYADEAGRLIKLLVEYKPLTEYQWACQTPQQRAQWEQAERLEAAYERLMATDATDRFSPELIEIMIEAGRQVHFRPHVSEAVAPYIEPATPETCDLSSGEAIEQLHNDWLYQADGSPTKGRILQEIGWARQLAARICDHSGQQNLFASELKQLAELERQARSALGENEELYFSVRAVKRGITFRNPVVNFDRVVFVDMPFPRGSEWPHETRHRLGYMAIPGARLLVLEGLGPDGHLEQLMPQAPLHGSFWRPDVSFDGRKIVFCFKPHNEKAFHLYEINADGTGLTQLTDGPYDDLDPIYMPDDRHVVFSTTRGHTYVRCMPPTNAFVLARYDRQSGDTYLISRNNEPDYLPSVMHDGRIVYTRWEYTDKPLWRAQSLWTMNPDGTQVNAFWGNQSVWPDLLKDVRGIPGSDRVMFTGSAHHNWFSGSIGIIDPDKGFNFPHGLTKVTADVAWPECGNGPVDPVESPDYHASGRYTAFYSPYPLSERDFLVSANRGGKFVLYLMDVDGNRELIYEGTNHVFHAMPVRPRPRPPVIMDRVDWPTRESRFDPKDGVIYSNNVYQGAPPELKGRARYLRILNIDPKTYTYWHKRPYISTGPVVSLVQSEGVKRILGTVPIEADGSVAFRAPSGMALHFQLLDERFRALQTMRSFTGVMPGERRGCLGCHESHSRTPVYDAPALALAKEPQPITPPPWSDVTVSFPRYVQPVLDRYCVRCHGGDGEEQAEPNLTQRPGFLMFDEPYVTLTGRPTWGKSYQQPSDPPPGWGIAGMLMVEAYGKTDPEAYQTPRPMTALSYRSRLIDLAGSGEHHGVRVDPVNLRRMIVWVDAMCPYRGEEEVRAIPDPDFQGVDWLSVRPRIQTAPRIVRPGPVE